MTNFNWHDTAIEAAGLTGLGALGLLYEHSISAQRKRMAAYERFELRFPVDVEVDAVVHLLIDLLAPLRRRQARPVFDVIVFEVTAVDGKIRHAIEVPSERVEYVRSSLYATLPGARLTPVERDNEEPSPRAAIELGLNNSRVPLRAEVAAASNRSILAAFQPLRSDERLRLTWIMSNGAPPQGSSALQVVTGAVVPETPEPPISQLDSDDRRKRSLPLVAAVGRIAAWTEDVERARQLTGRVLAAMQSVAVPGVRITKRSLSEAKVVRRVTRRDVPTIEFPAVFNVREMTAVLGVPLESPSLPGVELVRGRPLPPAPQLPSTGRPIGVSTYPGRERPIAVPFSASSRHLWAVGASGSGKSWLLTNQALADIAQPHRPVIVIDMKSDTVDAILARYPLTRDGDLRVLDVTASRPLGLNPLADAHRQPDLIADNLFNILRRLWRLDAAPRTADALHVSLLTLARTPGSTLIDLEGLLTNANFRARVARPLRDVPGVGNYWAAFDTLSEGERAQVRAPLLTRIRQVLLPAHMRLMLGQPQSTVDFDRVLREGQVVLVPLSSGIVGPESSALLAAIVLSQLWSAAQRRAAIPENRRRPAAVFIDEWQLAAAGVTDMSEVLSLARGYNVGFALFNQYAGQLHPELREAVTTNAATKVVFATSAANAGSLAREFASVSADDIQGLGRFEALASIALGTATAPPVTVRTHPLPPAERSATELRRANAERFGRPREEVDAELAARYRGDEDAGSPGVRRRQS